MRFNTRSKKKLINGVVGFIGFVFVELPFRAVGFVHQLLRPLFKGSRKR
jgi:hypothetical protein